MTTTTEVRSTDIATGSTVLYARTVAYMLEKHLQKCEDGSVHWVSTANDEVPWELFDITWHMRGKQSGYLRGIAFALCLQPHAP